MKLDNKFALTGMTKNIAFAYAPQKIRCNIVCPSGVGTEVGVNIQSPSQFGMGRVLSGTANAIREGSASEIATAVLFLACDDSSLINGATLVADGGWTAY